MADPLSTLEHIEGLVDPCAADERAVGERLAEFLLRELPEGRGAALEAASAFPGRELRAFAASGLVKALVPEDQGGTLDWARAMRLCARFAAHDLDVTLCLGGMVLGAMPLLVAGSREQRARYFGPVLKGEMGGLGLSEWEHGSDLVSGACRAAPVDAEGNAASEKDAVAFVLDGTKSPTNNGSVGANVVVLARTSDGDDAFAHTLFLVPRGTPGMLAVPRFDSLGYRTMDLSGVALKGARLGREMVIGAVGEGFVIARRALEISRSGVATMGVGAHATALALALGHARSRKLYGAPILELGGVKRLVAAVTGRLLVASALSRWAVRCVGAWGGAARSWTSVAKLVCPALLEASVHDAGTVLGARSLMNDLPFGRLRRAAPVLAIFDGSSQLQLDELWRHAAAWKDAALDVEAVRGPAARVWSSERRPFVAEGDDAGGLAATSPPVVLSTLGGEALAPFADAARVVAEHARGLRGQPQERRFRVSELAAPLAALAAVVLAARAGSGDAAALEAALAWYAASISGDLAAGLVELATDADRAAHAALAARVLEAPPARPAAERTLLAVTTPL